MFTRKRDNSKSEWKEKAKKRRLDMKVLKKSLKELIKSRDQWKKKAANSEAQVNELQKELEELKKN